MLPEGRRQYGPWDPVTSNLVNAEVQEVDSEPLRKALERSKERMKLTLSSGKPPAQEAADVEKKETVLIKATPKRKSEKFGLTHVEEVDSSEYTLDSDIEEGESEAYEEYDEAVKVPEENEEDLKALREEKSQDLTKKDLKALEEKKREEKEPSQKKPQPVGLHLVLWLTSLRP